MEAGYELDQRGHSGDGQEAGRLASAGGGSLGRWGGEADETAQGPALKYTLLSLI